jgi:hypothetical protein
MIPLWIRCCTPKTEEARNGNMTMSLNIESEGKPASSWKTYLCWGPCLSVSTIKFLTPFVMYVYYWWIILRKCFSFFKYLCFSFLRRKSGPVRRERMVCLAEWRNGSRKRDWVWNYALVFKELYIASLWFFFIYIIVIIDITH